jgi:HSP20 family molecular chaperone IbpA
MTQELRATMVPALPPLRLTADIYETAGGEAYVIEILVPGLKPDEIVIEANSYSLTVSTEPQQAEPDSGRRYIQRE